MKIDPIPIASLAALTLMSGAVLSHWMGIDERIELAQLRAAPAMDAGTQPLIVPITEPPPGLLATRTAEAPARPVASAELGQRFLHALESFEQLQRENRDLRDQVAETNRDLLDLQFRVDTHSESFRPLRTAPQEPERLAGPGVLPPLETP
jgi:hypothetical protein